MTTWIERTPLAAFIIVAALFAIVPFGNPHLPEKLRMLFSGTLRRPLDWFDLVMHSAPLALLIVKLVVDGAKRFR